MSRPRSPYLALEKRIDADERGGIMHRWEYGRELLKAKAGRKQLPDGMAADLVKAAGVRKNGRNKISEREIQYRLKFAETYASDQQVRSLIADLGTWTEIIRSGFPEVDGPDSATDEDDLNDIPDAAPDEWEQLSLIPGFKSTVKVHGREVPLEEATVGDVVAYRDKYRRMHEGFGKTLALIEASVDTILDAANGDMGALVIDAWSRAVDSAAAVGDEPESERVA